MMQVIVQGLGKVYRAAGMVRLLLSILIALGLFASPMLMTGGVAEARVPDAAHHVGSHDGHCGQTMPDGDDRTAPQDLACSGICTAFLTAVPTLAELASRCTRVSAGAGPAKLFGLEPGHDPPPPRFAPVM